MQAFAFADLGAGLQAFCKGDYATALNELLPLAKQGTPEAQFSLGFMYSHGQGVEAEKPEREAGFSLSTGIAASPGSRGIRLK
jgi:TPR repeat protein